MFVVMLIICFTKGISNANVYTCRSQLNIDHFSVRIYNDNVKILTLSLYLDKSVKVIKLCCLMEIILPAMFDRSAVLASLFCQGEGGK